MLTEIGAGELPQLLVYNKIDRLGLEPHVERDAEGAVTQVWISAAQGHGLELLRDAITERLELGAVRGWLHMPPAAGALRARLYAQGAVREERSEADGSMSLLVELPPAQMAAMAHDPQVKLRLIKAAPCVRRLPCLESVGSAAPARRGRAVPVISQ